MASSAPSGSVGTRFAVLSFVFLVVFFLWPVSQLLVRGLADSSGSVWGLIGSSGLRSVIWFTIWQAALSTALTFVIALPLAAVLANVSFRGRRLVWAVVTVPFVLPTVVVGGAFLATADRWGLEEGPFALRRSVLSILAAHVFFNVAVVVRTVGGYWGQLSRDTERAARLLGSSPVRAFFGVTLRRLRPAIAAAAAIVYLFTFTSFGVVLILGGTRQRTIETEIYRYAVSRTDFGTAAGLSVLQLLAVVALVVVTARLRGRLPRADAMTTDRGRPIESRAMRAGVAGVVVVTLGLLAIPIAALVTQSLSTGSGVGLGHYRALTERPLFLTVSPARTIVNSLGFAAVATVIATTVGGSAAFAIAFGRRSVSRLLELGYLLPLGTSAVTLGFGILLTFDTGLLDLRSSWVIIPLTQALIGIPFVTRAVVPVLQSIDPALREAAASMGADPARVRRDIDLPIARRALVVGAGFAFAISLGEFGATSFVGRRPDLMTVPLAIERLLGQPGELLRGQAMALSVVLMVTTTIVLLLVDRFDRGGVL
jgi:thiamine transport system permease protein